MDAKSRAKFINSVAKNQGIPCPSCNHLNEPDSLFCVICGTRLDAPAEPEPPKADNTRCPVCQAEIMPDALFCFSCGARLDEVGEDVYIPQEEEDAYIPQEEADAFVPQEEEGAFVPQEEAAAFIPQKETAAFVPQEENVPNNSMNTGAPAFNPVAKKPVKPAPQRTPVQREKKPVQKRIINFAVPEEDTEEVSVFAQGLPEWDIVPPQVPVRRNIK